MITTSRPVHSPEGTSRQPHRRRRQSPLPAPKHMWPWLHRPAALVQPGSGPLPFFTAIIRIQRFWRRRAELNLQWRALTRLAMEQRRERHARELARAICTLQSVFVTIASLIEAQAAIGARRDAGAFIAAQWRGTLKTRAISKQYRALRHGAMSLKRWWRARARSIELHSRWRELVRCVIAASKIQKWTRHCLRRRRWASVVSQARACLFLQRWWRSTRVRVSSPPPRCRSRLPRATAPTPRSIIAVHAWLQGRLHCRDLRDLTRRHRVQLAVQALISHLHDSIQRRASATPLLQCAFRGHYHHHCTRLTLSTMHTKAALATYLARQLARYTIARDHLQSTLMTYQATRLARNTIAREHLQSTLLTYIARRLARNTITREHLQSTLLMYIARRFARNTIAREHLQASLKTYLATKSARKAAAMVHLSTVVVAYKARRSGRRAEVVEVLQTTMAAVMARRMARREHAALVLQWHWRRMKARTTPSVLCRLGYNTGGTLFIILLILILLVKTIVNMTQTGRREATQGDIAEETAPRSAFRRYRPAGIFDQQFELDMTSHHGIGEIVYDVEQEVPASSSPSRVSAMLSWLSSSWRALFGARDNALDGDIATNGVDGADDDGESSPTRRLLQMSDAWCHRKPDAVETIHKAPIRTSPVIGPKDQIPYGEFRDAGSFLPTSITSQAAVASSPLTRLLKRFMCGPDACPIAGAPTNEPITYMEEVVYGESSDDEFDVYDLPGSTMVPDGQHVAAAVARLFQQAWRHRLVWLQGGEPVKKTDSPSTIQPSPPPHAAAVLEGPVAIADESGVCVERPGEQDDASSDCDDDDAVTTHTTVNGYAALRASKGEEPSGEDDSSSDSDLSEDEAVNVDDDQGPALFNNDDSSSDDDD